MTKFFKSSPVLVSKTRTGNDKYWQCHIKNDGADWFTLTEYWQVNKAGKESLRQQSEPYQCTPKNVGKANETSAQEQAELEFTSIVKKQMDKGYAEIGEESDILPLPMLAQKYKDRVKKGKIEYPVTIQRKYNGQRMLFNGQIGWSRTGKLNISEVIAHLQFNTQGYLLDGELILPGNKLLQESMKAVKKFVPGLSDTLQYIVYDVVDTTLGFADRYELLVRLLKNAPVDVRLAPIHVASDNESVFTLHKQFVAEGFEGTMIRIDDMPYEIGHRSNQLLKLKDFQDAEFKILDVISGEGSYTGCAIFVCSTNNGVVFNCNPEGTMQHKMELYKNRNALIGKKLTIRYFELSNDGVPLFPVGVDVREDI